MRSFPHRDTEATGLFIEKTDGIRIHPFKGSDVHQCGIAGFFGFFSLASLSGAMVSAFSSGLRLGGSAAAAGEREIGPSARAAWKEPAAAPSTTPSVIAARMKKPEARLFRKALIRQHLLDRDGRQWNVPIRKCHKPPRRISRINSSAIREIRFIKDDERTLRSPAFEPAPGGPVWLPLAAGFRHVVGSPMAILRHRAPYFNVIHRRCGPDFLGK